MNRLVNTEKKQRIRQLLKRKLPEKSCISAVHPKEKENTINKRITNTSTIAITNNEEIVEQNPNILIQKSMTATTNTTMNNQNESCVICGKNLSRYFLDIREMHVNACLDNKIEIETNSTSLMKSETKKLENKEQQHSLFAIAMVCPCCNITFKAKTEKGKLNHFKMCGKKHKYTPNKMLEFLQELKIKYGRDPPNYISSKKVLSKPGTTSLNKGSKEKKLTSYFNPISNDKNKSTKIDPTSKEENSKKLSYVISRSYNVSVLDYDDDDFQSSIVFKARSTIEKSNKRKKEIDDDDFQVGVALSKSVLPERKRKKVKYDLNTTPILPCEDAIKRAKERAKTMFFNRPTICEIAKNLSSPKFPESKLGKKYTRRNYNEIESYPNRKNLYTLWEIQAFGGYDNPLTRDDYITDMIWHYREGDLDDRKIYKV